jgi:pyruvate formate lyase activating enzyme
LKIKNETLATGVIYDLKKFAVHDGPGIRTTVFLKGCPLTCWWCHNPESQKLEPEPRRNLQHKSNLKIFRRNQNFIGAQVTVSEVLEEFKKDQIFFEESGGGVTFSGGEPLMQPEFLTELLRACKNRDFHTAVDTSGHAPYSNFEKINDSVDLFLYDLKLIDDKQHQKYTGVSNRLILENLKKLVSAGKKIHIRVPLIPGIIDTEENLQQIITFLLTLDAGLPVNLLPYNQIGESKYERLGRENLMGKQKMQTSLQLLEIENTFRRAGIQILAR